MRDNGTCINHRFTIAERSVKGLFERLYNECTEKELSTSATLEVFEDDLKLCTRILDYLNRNLKSKEKLIDLSCGYSILTILFKEFLNIKEAYDADIDNNKLMIANKLLGSDRVFIVDLERDPLPFSDVSNPNLGWWIDRLSLLLGYQLSNIEVSEYYSVGLIPFYPRSLSLRYFHALTLKGMRELLKTYSFRILKVWSVKITQRALNRVHNKFLKWHMGVIDKFFGIFSSLRVRTLPVANKFM